jgi:hypothetical protein
VPVKRKVPKRALPISEPSKKRPDPLRAFIQHGVVFSKRSGNERIGNCPFCGKEKHFSVNEKTKQWQCKRGATKVCAKGGGFATFLRGIHLFSVKEFNDETGNKLSVNRGLNLQTLRRAGIGYNINTDAYTIPIPEPGNPRNLHDLRHYHIGRNILSTAGCSVGLYRWENMQIYDTIWICEGEWDTLTIDEILFNMEKQTEYVVGVPGAGTFKTDWNSLFTDKTVYLAYDNDKAGEAGCQKTFETLKGIVYDIKCINWPEGTSVGGDVRDLYQMSNYNAELTYKKLKSFFKEHPPGYDETSRTNVELKAGNQLKGERVNHKEVYRKFRKWLHLPDVTMIDVLFSTVIANRIPGDPLWMFIIAPPGATKTEPLMSLRGAPKIVTTTTLNQYALISGVRSETGADPSLIPQLDGKVLVIQDFTTILQLPPQKRDEIFGILRSAYDGRSEKAFGRGIKSFKSTFGIIAAVTPAVEQYIEACSSLGERFLGYIIPLPSSLKERREYLQKARSNVGREEQMKKELNEMSVKVLSHAYKKMSTIPATIENKLDSIAQLTSMMRGTVSRDRYTREVTQKPYTELGTRLVKQLTKEIVGIAQFRGHSKATQEDYNAIKQIARGTIPSLSLNFLDSMYLQGEHGAREWSSREISEEVRIAAWPTGERVLENLSMLGVLDTINKEGVLAGRKKAYKINEEVIELIETGEMI